MTSPTSHDETFTDNLGNSRAPAREEQPRRNRPNLLRRWIDRALGMGTPGEWAEDAAAFVTLLAGLVLFTLFVVMFAP